MIEVADFMLKELVKLVKKNKITTSRIRIDYVNKAMNFFVVMLNVNVNLLH